MQSHYIPDQVPNPQPCPPASGLDFRSVAWANCAVCLGEPGRDPFTVGMLVFAQDMNVKEIVCQALGTGRLGVSQET
jgi:hypothetical protein